MHAVAIVVTVHAVKAASDAFKARSDEAPT